MPRPSITLNDALQDYYDQRSPRYATNTWRGHECQLEKFRKWAARPDQAGADCLLTDIDERMMVRYFNRMRGVLSGSTFNGYRQYLNMFFDYCKGEAWIDRNPMRHVDPAPVRREPRLQLSAQELLSLLDGANPRDRMALALGMHTALRGGDILALKVGDVNLTNLTLHAAIKKTGQYEELPINAELHAEIMRWFPHYAEAMGLKDWMKELPNEWQLVPPRQFIPWNVWEPENGRVVYHPRRQLRHAERIVHDALKRIGHPTYKEGFHTLRRSAARQVFEMAKDQNVGSPIRIAQAMLGHKNQSVTEVYLGITHEKGLRDDMLRGKSFLHQRASAEKRKVDEAAKLGVEEIA